MRIIIHWIRLLTTDEFQIVDEMKGKYYCLNIPGHPQCYTMDVAFENDGEKVVLPHIPYNYTCSCTIKEVYQIAYIFSF